MSMVKKSNVGVLALLLLTQLTMSRSQPISASVKCGFHVQNPDSDADADLLRDQNYQLF